MHVEVLHARHIFNLQDTVPLLWHAFLIGESLRNELTHRKSKTEGLENVSNLCNFQLFASNIYGNNIDQRLRNCGEAKTFMGPTYILCKISNFLSTLDWERPSLRRKKQKAFMMYKTMNDLAPEYLQSLYSQRHSAYNLKNSWGKADPVQTKHQLFETKLLLQRGHVME